MVWRPAIHDFKLADMRIWSLLLILLGIWGNLYAQSVFFLPFNQSRQEVREYLTAQSYIPSNGVKEKPDMQTILAILSEDRQVEYAFKEDRLYATTVIQNYRNPIDAEKRRQECIDYMKQVGADSIEEKAYGKIICYTGITGERVLKLFVRRHVGSTTLTFSSIQERYFESRQGENKFFYEIDLLQENTASRGDQ